MQAETGMRERSLLTGYVFALSAAAAYGSGQVLARQVVDDVASPVIGALIALVVGTLVYAPLSRRVSSDAVEGNTRRGYLHFAAAGTLSSIAVVLSFIALETGKVVIVSPITNTSPIFTLLFAAFLLRDIERMRREAFIGAALVVAGVIVLTLSRN